MKKINIWCDASQKYVERTELNPRGRKVSFAAWVANTGHYWFDLVWAKPSRDAEITAVFVALDWGINEGYQTINIYTDDKSIPESLYGARKGEGMGDLPTMINESAAEINIIHIPRRENQAAHRLCNEAFAFFQVQGEIPHGGKKTRAYMTHKAIQAAQKRGIIRTVNILDNQTGSGAAVATLSKKESVRKGVSEYS